MRPMAGYGRSGFTLVELMIGMALSMIIMGVVAYGFFVTSQATKRGLGTNDLHEQASAIYTLMRNDFANRVPGSGWTYRPETNIAATNFIDTFTITVTRPNADANYDGTISAAESGSNPAQVEYQFECRTPASPTYLDEEGRITTTIENRAFFPYTFFQVRRKEAPASNYSNLLTYGPAVGDEVFYLPISPRRAGEKEYGPLALCNGNGERIYVDVFGSGAGEVAIRQAVNEQGSAEHSFFRLNADGTLANSRLSSQMSAMPRALLDHPNNNVNAPAYVRIHIPFVATTDAATLREPTQVARQIRLDGVGVAPGNNAAAGSVKERDVMAWYFKL